MPAFRPLRFVLLLPFLALAACSGSPLTPPEANLRENRARWEARGFTAYRYTLSVNCFCGVELVRPVEITVRDGAPLSVTYEDTGEPADRERFSRFDTVGELFDVLDAAFDEGAASVSAEYDAEFGYPRQVFMRSWGGAWRR
ncbi:hypothetical protein BH23GEM4_BH23GEM4_08890 [soil metagenome]